MASLARAIILLSLASLAAALSPAPAPAAAPDPVKILKKAKNYSTLLTLLTEANLVETIGIQLQRKEGLTIFAPTNAAFKKINKTLAALTPEQKIDVLTYHGLPQYVGYKLLFTLSNPVRTLASIYTFDITGNASSVNVSTGVVNTMVENPLYDRHPLGIYPVEDVLIPVFAKATAPSAGPPAPPPSSARLQRVGWVAILGAGVALLSFSFYL